MTMPTLRSAERADILNAVIAAHPLHSGRIIRTLALAAPRVPGRKA
jgi:hypothetical protein